MEITRELDKKSLLNCYPIYTWSVLLIITPALIVVVTTYHKEQMISLNE